MMPAMPLTKKIYTNGGPNYRASKFLHPTQHFIGSWRLVREPTVLPRWERRVSDPHGIINIMRIFIFEDGSLAHPILSRKW